MPRVQDALRGNNAHVLATVFNRIIAQANVYDRVQPQKIRRIEHYSELFSAPYATYPSRIPRAHVVPHPFAYQRENDASGGNVLVELHVFYDEGDCSMVYPSGNFHELASALHRIRNDLALGS